MTFKTEVDWIVFEKFLDLVPTVTRLFDRLC